MSMMMMMANAGDDDSNKDNLMTMKTFSSEFGINEMESNEMSVHMWQVPFPKNTCDL